MWWGGGHLGLLCMFGLLLLGLLIRSPCVEASLEPSEKRQRDQRLPPAGHHAAPVVIRKEVDKLNAETALSGGALRLSSERERERERKGE